MGRPYADECCPDCGGSGQLEVISADGNTDYWIECFGCHGEGSI